MVAIVLTQAQNPWREMVGFADFNVGTKFVVLHDQFRTAVTPGGGRHYTYIVDRHGQQQYVAETPEEIAEQVNEKLAAVAEAGEAASRPAPMLVI